MLPFNNRGFIHVLETLLRFAWSYEEKVFSDDLQSTATVLMSVTKIKYSVSVEKGPYAAQEAQCGLVLERSIAQTLKVRRPPSLFLAGWGEQTNCLL